ncbi:MAG: hypothetical protein ACK4NW_08265 [Roseinatronobacter sp.]
MANIDLISETVPPVTDLGTVLTLQQGRAHEFCGAARRVLAVWTLAQSAPDQMHLWIRMRWGRDRLFPQGLGDWLCPSRLITLDAARDAEMLACAEEALRSGAVASVTLEMAAPPALTPLRRLHLAAESGLARRQTRSRSAGLLALVLTPGDGGTPGVESRWQLVPCPAPNPPRINPVQPRWRLRRLRARMAPPAAWHVDGAKAVSAAALRLWPERSETGV